jgi:hypothetical protein
MLFKSNLYQRPSLQTLSNASAVLSERLTKYSDDFFILNENQCGFRKGYSTLDNLFVDCTTKKENWRKITSILTN